MITDIEYFRVGQPMDFPVYNNRVKSALDKILSEKKYSHEIIPVKGQPYFEVYRFEFYTVGIVSEFFGKLALELNEES